MGGQLGVVNYEAHEDSQSTHTPQDSLDHKRKAFLTGKVYSSGCCVAFSN